MSTQNTCITEWVLVKGHKMDVGDMDNATYDTFNNILQAYDKKKEDDKILINSIQKNKKGYVFKRGPGKFLTDVNGVRDVELCEKSLVSIGTSDLYIKRDFLEMTNSRRSASKKLIGVESLKVIIINNSNNLEEKLKKSEHYSKEQSDKISQYERGVEKSDRIIKELKEEIDSLKIKNRNLEESLREINSSSVSNLWGLL